MSYIPGQRCVCVRDYFPFQAGAPYGGAMPVKGQVYTIRDVLAYQAGDIVCGIIFTTDMVFLLLEEIPGSHCFDAVAFRPFRETSIEVFKRLLVNPPKIPVSA